jgi:hypothetical protein
MFQHRNRAISFLAIGVLGLLLTCQESVLAQTAKPSSQASTPSTPTLGQRIGTVVKDAIATAFPGAAGIGGLVDAIWAKKPTSGNNVNKPQLNQAATSAQDDIKKQIVAQAQQKLTPLAAVVDELQIVGQFGVPTVTASTDIIKMSDRLKSGKTLQQDDWTAERADWAEAKGELQTLNSVPDLSKVQDLWLRDKLSKIKQTNITAVARIDTELKPSSPSVELLSKDLDGLYATLSDISAAVGYEISNMQADVKSLSDWANGAAGSEKITLSPAGNKYVNFLNARYK